MARLNQRGGLARDLAVRLQGDEMADGGEGHGAGQQWRRLQWSSGAGKVRRWWRARLGGAALGHGGGAGEGGARGGEKVRRRRLGYGGAMVKRRARARERRGVRWIRLETERDEGYMRAQIRS
jgi:hypothetical protein